MVYILMHHRSKKSARSVPDVLTPPPPPPPEVSEILSSPASSGELLSPHQQQCDHSHTLGAAESVGAGAGERVESSGTTSDHLLPSVSSGLASPEHTLSSGHMSPLKTRSRSPSPKVESSSGRFPAVGTGVSSPAVTGRPARGVGVPEVRREGSGAVPAVGSIAPPASGHRKSESGTDYESKKLPSPETQRKTESASLTGGDVNPQEQQYLVSFSCSVDSPQIKPAKLTTTKPAELTIKPVELTTKSAKLTTNPAELTTKPAELTIKPAKRATKPAELTTKSAKLTTNPAELTIKPAELTTKPAKRATNPAELTTKPAELTIKPAKRATKPAELTTKPAELTIKPAKRATKPAELTTELTMKSAELTTKQVKLTTKPAKLTTGTRRIVKKPGVERDTLISFFAGKIAREQKEVLMSILWGGASVTSAPGCEVESGLFVSDKGLYLLQVVDTEGEKGTSWYTENPPLVCSFHAYHVTLSQVKMGIFDQSITFECIEKGALKSLVVFPRTSENTLSVLDNLKAALDAGRIEHGVTTMQESLLSSSEGERSKVLFVNPDVSDLQKLKESLVNPTVLAQLCSHKMAGYYETSGAPSFTEEIKHGCEESAAKFEILQYVVVSEISSDLLPVGNGAVHFRPRVLVLTNGDLYLCSDEAALCPTNPDSPISPPSPSCIVLDSCPIKSVTEIEMCERAQSIVRISDPVYEFRISFSDGSAGVHRWKLCVYDRQYIDQLFTCLQLLWRDVNTTMLPLTHTTEPLTPLPSSPTKKKRSRSFSEKPNLATYDPVFYKSQVLLNLAGLTSSARLQFFKERVSEAQFMKSDEVPLAVFLAVCSRGGQDAVQIEVCVMASQYAVYLVSDVDNIRKWLDCGGPSSFSRMSLLNKKGAGEARCLYRVWINEIREIDMGFFYLSMRLRGAQQEHEFCVHSQDATSMLALLSAVSCSAILRNSQVEKEMDQLLSEYIDLTGGSLSGKPKQVQKSAKTNVEFRGVLLENEETLKQILLCISPSVARSTTVEESTSGLHIILGLVMMIVEEINIRGTHTVQYRPRLVLLSNYGIFVCGNSSGENATPAVLEAADLKVKRWCHIDLIEQVELVSSNPQLKQWKGHVFCINLQSQRGAADWNTLVLAAQNTQQLRQFLYHLSLLWSERKERSLPIYTV